MQSDKGHDCLQSGKPDTIRESNQASRVHKAHHV